MTRVVVFDAERDLYLGTNNSGSVLWKALAAGATRSQLVGLLVERFDIEQDRVMSQMAVFAAVTACSRNAWWVRVSSSRVPSASVTKDPIRRRSFDTGLTRAGESVETFVVAASFQCSGSR